MDDKDKLINTLQNKIYTLELKVEHLQSILKEHKIEYELFENSVNKVDDKTELTIKQEEITKEHAKFFYSMFKGRQDVYSKRGSKPNPKTGKTRYYTQCSNFWKDNICYRRYGSKITCKNCEHQIYRPLLGGDVVNHLVGDKVDCSDVIGLYPMFEDKTCNFLVFDFDNHDDKSKLDDLVNVDNEWIDEVNAMKEICENNGVPILLERSRSGKGAHIWMFFDEPILAKEARIFGTALLTKGAETVNLKNFKSYDRMLPAQDNLSLNGLGNLIALPLQGQALKQGNSAFIDEHWNVYYDQWKVLRETKKLSKVFIEEKISEWSAEGVFGSLADDMSGLSILKITIRSHGKRDR